MLVRLQRAFTWQRTMEISQWIVPLVSFYFIWWIIDSKTHHSNFIYTWNRAFDGASFFLLISGMLIFTFFNLFFESMKWKYSLREIKFLTYKEAFIQTLKAMAAGFITPFRSGAILARFIANENTDRNRIIDLTIQMAIAQFMVTFFMGMVGLGYWLFLEGWWNYFYLDLGVIFVSSILVLLFYWHPVRFQFRNTQWNGLNLDLKLLLISFLRYLVFTIQYLILLWFFGAEIEFFHAFGLISMTFLANSFLPSGILGKIGIRELSAILIIGETTGFLMEASCAAFMIWILNQALPAFIGSVLFLISATREH